jgi:hypothetical protein
VPNVVHLRAAAAYRHNPQVLPAMTDRTYPAVAVCSLGYDRPIEVSSLDRAHGIEYRWEQYRGLWWLFAAIAGLVVARELLPVPRLFGRDDD